MNWKDRSIMITWESAKIIPEKQTMLSTSIVLCVGKHLHNLKMAYNFIIPNTNETKIDTFGVWIPNPFLFFF
jgi:hypothetical protein